MKQSARSTRAAAAAVFIAASACSVLARAAIIDSSRVLVGNGGWTVFSGWSPMGVPNNTASNSYRVTINNGYETRVQNFAPTIDSVTIGSSSSLSLYEQPLTVLDQFTLNGKFSAIGDCTVRLGRAGAPTTLAGNGTVEFFAGSVQLVPNGPFTITDGITIEGDTINVGASPYSLVNGAPIFSYGTLSLIGSQIVNSGDINARDLGIISGSTFTNSGALVSTGTATTSIVCAGTFLNAGTWIGNSTSTLTISAPYLVNTGRIVAQGTLLFGATPASLTNSGTIELFHNTTVGPLANANGTITLNNVRLTAPGPRLGSDLGTINGTGTLSVTDLDNTGNELHANVNMNIGGTFRGGTLTTAAGRTVYVGGNFAALDGVTINGNLDYSWPSPWQIVDGKLNGNGTVTISFGTVTTSAAQLSVGTALTVRAIGATIGDRNKPFENFGKITGAVIAGNPIRNYGEIGGAAFDGTYSLSSLGNLTGTSYTILGTLLNDGYTLSVHAGTPSWTLGGTIRGGTIETGDGRTIRLPYVFAGPGQYTNRPALDNVVMNARLVVDNNTLSVVNGELIGNGTVTLYPLAGTFVGRVASATPTLTIGSEITIRSGGASSNLGLGGAVGSPGSFTQRAIINHGTLRADPPALFGLVRQELDLFGMTIFNDGALVIGSDGLIFAAQDIQFGSPSPTTLTFGTGGVLDVDLSATAGWGLLQVTGTLDLTTSGDQLLLARAPGTSDGTFYRIVTTADGVIGQFDSVTPGFDVEYRNGTEIWARFVPEPAIALLLGAAPFLALLRRHRSKFA